MKKKSVCKFLILLFVGAFIAVISCNTSSRVPINDNNEVTFLRYQNGVLTVRSVGYGKNNRDAIFDAEKNVFKNLIFIGISNSAFDKAMAGGSIDKEKQQYLESFFKKDYYRRFLSESVLIKKPYKDKVHKCFKAEVEVTVNYYALRKELEQNGIIHEFGY